MLSRENIREVAGNIQWTEWSVDIQKVEKYIDSILSDYGLTTYEDEIACAFQSIGCTVTAVYDYIDGSPTYTVSLPADDNEYRENIKEAQEWAEN